MNVIEHLNFIRPVNPVTYEPLDWDGDAYAMDDNCTIIVRSGSWPHYRYSRFDVVPYTDFAPWKEAPELGAYLGEIE